MARAIADIEATIQRKRAEVEILTTMLDTFRLQAHRTPTPAAAPRPRKARPVAGPAPVEQAG